MSKIQKRINTVFRILIFLTAITFDFSLFKLIRGMFLISDDLITDGVSEVGISLYCYYGLTGATLLCIILSCVLFKCTKTVTFIFRTLSLTGIFCGEFYGILSSRWLALVYNVVIKNNITSDEQLNNLTKDNSGLSQAQINMIENFSKQDEYRMAIFIIVWFLAAILFFLLTLTSIHSLATMNSNKNNMNNDQMYNPTDYKGYQ